MSMRPRFLLLMGLLLVFKPELTTAAGAIYFVSSSGGSDDNDGLSEGAPFETVTKVNSLNLQPGDQVLFKCGDTWQAEHLVVSHSGTESDPITFGSYPADCADRPSLSGSRPISGWSVHAGAIYVATLPAGEFPMGINQFFRDGERLTFGRWPNLDAGDGGYSFVDSHTAGSNQLVDNQLPGGDWTGAIMPLKNILW